jgi:putative ABC transport system permease protein
MFRNYLKLALRNIKRHKGYALINIASLAVGIACCILILLWVQGELSFDRFHKNAKEIYRVAVTNEQGDFHGYAQPSALASYLEKEYPEITHAASVSLQHQRKLGISQTGFFCSGQLVDPCFFEIFTFPLFKGDPKTALNSPSSLVITEELARKIFGDSDPIGKVVKYEDRADLMVTGALKNIPKNSHLQFEFLRPYPNQMKLWNVKSVHTYVLLQKNIPYQEVSKKIANVMNLHNPSWKNILYLQPMTKSHLFNLDSAWFGEQKIIIYIYLFSAMAIIILLIACINFMNLATARSEARFKEIGIKKVVGASRAHLIRQFLSESSLLSLISLGLAVLLVQGLLPTVNSMLGLQLELRWSGSIFLSLAAIALMTGLLAGSYPAFFLSSFHPVRVLKGSVGSAGTRSLLLRRILVVTQFSLSIVFIISALVILSQLKYIKNKDLGFDKENIVIVQARGELLQQSPTIKSELLQNPSITSIAFSINRLDRWESSSGVEWSGRASEVNFDMGINWVDYDFLKTFGLEMAEGRFFSREFSTDKSGACVVNEAAIKAMHMKDPIGQKISAFGGELKGTIVGVIKDYHTETLHKEIRPFAIFLREAGEYMCARIKGNNISGTLDFMKNKIREFVPNDPFQFSFLDEEFGKLYKADQLTGRLVTYLTVLAIFVSCLGLFGLATFTVEKRIKEIGVRKVLGASVSGIVLLLSKEFLKLVLMANLIAWPIAYYFMSRWLQNFAYRTSIGIGIFIISGLLALAIALLTVSYQSIKAALANPVDSLRYE